METTLFLCFGVWHIVASQLPPPVSLLPLAKSSFSYDVIKGTDGKYPNLTDCFKADETGNPALRYGALYLDDVDNSFIDIALTGPSMETFAMSLQLYAERESFTVMHYRSENSAGLFDDVNKIEIKMRDRKLTIYLSNVGYVSVTNFLDLNTWITLTFSYNYVSGQLKAYKNEDLVGSMEGFTQNELILPGILRLGNPISSIFRNQFKGMMTCFSLYAVSEGFDTNFGDIKTYCDADWTNPPPVAPVCFDEAPVCLFPLDDVNYACDVVSNIQPTNKDTCFRFTNPQSDLPNKTIYFDGSVTSTVRSNIPIKYLQKDFTIATFLYLSDYSYGTILEVFLESNPPLWDGIRRITVSVNQNKILQVRLYDSGLCADFLVPKILSYNKWYSFSLHRIKDSKRFSVVLGGIEMNITDSCDVSVIPNDFTASLFIGGGNDLINYQGQMRCLLVFNSWLHPSIVNERLKTICGKAQTDTGNVCDQKPRVRSQMFIKLKPNSIPEMDIEPILVMAVKDISRCSSNCVRTEFCRSFTLSDSHCSLYDFVTTVQFNTIQGTDYFVSQ